MILATVQIIESAKNHIESDPDLVAYMLRDLDATKAAGLSDLAWAMTQQGNNCAEDARYLIERLEAHMEASEQ